MRPYLRCVPGLLLAAGGVLASPAAAGQSPPAEQTPAGDEIGSLRRELQSLRDEYTSRIAAIESRLQALEGGRTAPAPPEATPAEPAAAPAPQPGPAPQSTAAVPAGAATGDTPATLPVYGGGSASSKVFNPDIAVIGNFLGAAGTTRPAASRRSRCTRRRVASRPSSIPTRAPTSSWRSGRTRCGGRGGLHHLPDAARRAPAEGRQDARRVRQGEHACTPTCCPGPTGRSCTQNLLGGEEGIADSGHLASRA